MFHIAGSKSNLKASCVLTISLAIAAFANCRGALLHKLAKNRRCGGKRRWAGILGCIFYGALTQAMGSRNARNFIEISLGARREK